MNIWVHDGSKDLTVERKRYREIFAESLDEILAEKLDGVKLPWSQTVRYRTGKLYRGKSRLRAGYCATRKLMYTLDTGHYEQTENVSDMIALTAVVRARTDVARQSPRTLGFRPCNHHERPDARPVQGTGTCRRTRPRPYRPRLFRRIYQPYRCLYRWYTCHTEVHPPGFAGATAHTAPLWRCRTELSASLFWKKPRVCRSVLYSTISTWKWRTCRREYIPSIQQYEKKFSTNALKLA